MMFLILLSLLVSVLTLFIRHHYTYWQRRGFPVGGTNIPFGCLNSVAKRQQSLGMALHDVYKETSERFVGIYFLFRPAILVRDAELARQILVQDFPSFYHRGIYCDEKNDPFSANLFALRGEQWRKLRTKLTPTFTSGKLKGMFGTIEDVSNKMIQHMDKLILEKGDGAATVEIKQILANFGIDVIASVILGLDVDSFKDPNNKLRMLSEQWSTPTFDSATRSIVTFVCPIIESFFFRLGMQSEANKYMGQMVRETVDFREKNNITRKDMMQMLIQLRNTGKVNLDDNIWDVETAADGFKSMSIECIAAQAFAFYIGGFETSSSAASFTLFELAQDPELYAKAQKDIDETIERHGGKITYETIQDMKYIDQCIMETIRKYPVLPMLNRECTKNYQIPNSDKIIEKGTPIVISLLGMHRDPKYFPNPMKYDPDRFLDTNKDFNSVAYMPFGDGPKHCIAPRLGKFNAKFAIAKIMTNFDFDVIKKGDIEIDNFALTIVPKGGVNLKFRRKKKC